MGAGSLWGWSRESEAARVRQDGRALSSRALSATGRSWGERGAAGTRDGAPRPAHPPDFTDRKAETRRGKGTCPGPHSQSGPYVSLQGR